MESSLPNSAFKSQCDMKKAEALFNQYQKSGDMEEEGIEKFFKDIGVDSDTDIVTNLVSMHMGAAKMGTYTKQEFTKGCQVLGVDTLAGWKTKRVYRYVFKFAAAQEGYNNLKLEDAMCLWEFFLSKKVPYLPQWLKFLEDNKGEYKTIQFDQWDMFYDLYKQTKGDLSRFEDDGSWPTIIDAFMAYI